MIVKCPKCGSVLDVKLTAVGVEEPSETAPDVEAILKRYEDYLEAERAGDGRPVSIRPAQWLGKDRWSEVNKALKAVGFEWVSAGKESRWRRA